jgi:large subunit ribosomal protein L6
MSKIGKKPIVIPNNVEVEISDGFLDFKGSNGSSKIKIPSYIKAEIKEGNILFSPENNSKQARANWGTIRSLANNAIIGLTEGFSKNLEVEGIGYRANMEGENLVLNLGLSHPIKFTPPQGIKISTEKNTIKISGIDNALVGQVAAKIRAFKKPEPYKGKGIRYQGEIVRRKVGKKVAGTTK